MPDYSKELGINEFFQANNAPVTQRTDFVTGYKFSQGYEVQTKVVRASVLTIDQMVNYSGTAAATGSVAGSTMVNIAYTLSPTSAYKAQTNLGVPFIAIYEGTVVDATKQIYPNYQLATSGKWYGNSGFNYHGWSGTESSYVVNLYNSGAGTSIYVVGQWKYISNNSGISKTS